MTTFFTSDTHYNHVNILKYCPGRRYDSIEAMNRDFISRWNARVGPDDTVWHLGDFALGQWEDAKPLFEELHGKEKHLILGNHDRTTTQMRSMGWASVSQGQHLPTLSDGRRIYMAHHPQTYEKLGRMKVSLQLCGHVHETFTRAQTREATQYNDWKTGEPLDHPKKYVAYTPDPQGRVINVGVDVRGFAPVTLAELLGD